MNTLSKSISIAAATVALAAPFATQASSYDAAMDTCINAFVAATLPKEQPVKIRKEQDSDTPLSVHSRAYKIIVTAKGIQSGKNVGRGSCVVDRDGNVVAVNGKPLTQKLASR